MCQRWSELNKIQKTFFKILETKVSFISKGSRPERLAIRLVISFFAHGRPILLA